MDAAVHVERLTKSFKKFQFGPVQFTAEKGTATAVVGPNGSGKTTFFRMLMKLIREDEGTIEIFGMDANEHETKLKQWIGYAGGQFQGLGQLTINEIARFCAYWHANWNHDRFAALAKRYDIDLAQRYNKCSTGTQKKVEIAIALSHAPKLLLLDEPTAGVDMISQRKIKEDLTNFLDEDSEHTLIMSTHAADDVKSLCDYICVLHQGKLAGTYDKDEIVQRWARIWIDAKLDQVAAHPAVIEVDRQSKAVITNHFAALEQALNEEAISVMHYERLGLDEILEYLIREKSA